jgi:glucan phosphoethanolaminetransferase (alkaline phosphatase superfamily)
MAAEGATVERADRGTPRIGPTRGELISALSALILLVLMFATAWYGVDGIPGAKSTSSAAAGAVNAWHGLTVIRWLLLATVLLAFAAVAIHARRPSRVAVARVRLALLALSMVTAGAVVFRVLIELPSSDRVVDQKLGGVLGMIAALGIVYGAYEAVREQRARLFELASRPGDTVASGRTQR